MKVCKLSFMQKDEKKLPFILKGPGRATGPGGLRN